MQKKLYDLCVEKNYFTCGDNMQYMRMFELARSGAPAHDVALVIWICSDNIDLDEIENEVRKVMEM